MAEERWICDCSVEDILDASIRALKKCGYSIEALDEDEGIIEASVGASLMSWGDHFYVQISRISSNKSEIYVSSEPKAQFFDLGKSKENINNFFSSLKEILED